MFYLLILSVLVYYTNGEVICHPGLYQYELQNNATRVTFDNNPASFIIRQIQANTDAGKGFYMLMRFLSVREVRKSDGEYIQSYEVSGNWTIECDKFDALANRSQISSSTSTNETYEYLTFTQTLKNKGIFQLELRLSRNQSYFAEYPNQTISLADGALHWQVRVFNWSFWNDDTMYFIYRHFLKL
jgi:hypothetical protein